MSNEIKKTPLKTESYLTNDTNFNTSYEQLTVSTEKIALYILDKAQGLASKYQGLVVTNGKDGRKAASATKDKLNAFTKEVNAMKKTFDTMIKQAIQPVEERKKELQTFIEESREADREEQREQAMQFASDLMQTLGFNPVFTPSSIIDFHSSEISNLSGSDLKRERYIADKLGYAMKYGVQVGKNTLDATTAEVILKEVEVTVRGKAQAVDDVVKKLEKKENIEVEVK